MVTISKSFIQRVERLADIRKTPFLAIDKKNIHHKFEQFSKAMPEAQMFYAVKTNPHKRIIEMLQALGAGFEISSEQELDLVLRSGASPEKIISSNPLKIPAFIESAHQAGITRFAFDSHTEIEKLAKYAPKSNVYIRLSVSNEGSEWPLNKKFGVETESAAELLVAAARKSLTPYGITFHVGSQCTSEKAWIEAIKKAHLVWEKVKNEGITLKTLNIGGGFPIKYTSSIPSIDNIADTVDKSLNKAFPEKVELHIEPGRALVGEAGILACSVIAKAKRNEEDWLYLDCGVFNGLFESVGGIQYAMTATKKGPMQKWVIAGPSCDSFDVISQAVSLPDLEIGDKVYIPSAGAYTTAYASRFNGFPLPKTYFI